MVLCLHIIGHEPRARLKKDWRVIFEGVKQLQLGRLLGRISEVDLC